MEYSTTSEFHETIAAKDTIVALGATWCGPCAALIPELVALDATYPDLRVIRIDVEASPELAQKYNVRAVPTILYFKDGALAGTTRGAQPASKIVETFEL